MARSGFSKLFGLGLAIGGAAGILSAIRDRAGAAPSARVRAKLRTAPHRALAAAAVAEPFAVPDVRLTTPRLLANDPSTAAAAQDTMVTAAPVAAPAGGATMATNSRQARIAELLRLTKAEPDAARKKALTDELVRLAKEEQAALQAAPAGPVPAYPPGLEASFGKRWARILKAWQDGQGVWNYAVDLESGEFLNIGSGQYVKSEPDLRAALESELGAMVAGQLYPRGIQVYRNGQGGLIESVTPGGAGGFTYVVRGWPNPVSQSELAAILRRA